MCIVHAGGFLNIRSDGEVISGYLRYKNTSLDDSLSLSCSPARGVLKVPTLLRADHWSLLWQQALLAPVLLLLVVLLLLTYTDGKLIAVGRRAKYVLSGQQVICLKVGMAPVPCEDFGVSRCRVGFGLGIRLLKAENLFYLKKKKAFPVENTVCGSCP